MLGVILLTGINHAFFILNPVATMQGFDRLNPADSRCRIQVEESRIADIHHVDVSFATVGSIVPKS